MRMLKAGFFRYIKNGFEATQRLKRIPATSPIPVIACSAFATVEYQTQAFEAGCEGYLTKPIQPERLVQQVVKFVLTSNIRKHIQKKESKISQKP
jgi:CheY-like chemotaxis protein